MSDAFSRPEPQSWKVASAFAAVYLIWGSTYLAIRFAIETLPPFAMAAVRFIIAGSVLYGIARRRAPRPTLAEWRAAAVIGTLLLAGGNGAVVWGQQWVPSGLAALLVATVPLWMVLIDWLCFAGAKPGRGLLLGLAWGLVGVFLLMSSGQIAARSAEALLGSVAILFAAVSWASGSVYSRGASLPRSPWMATAMEMLAGGLALGVMALFAGDWSEVDLSRVSAKSAVALAYLIVFGALIAFSAYVWLLRVSTPARVSTYAYVNPAVAVLLGWLLADERLDVRSGLGMLVILSAVVVVSLRGGESREPGRSTLVVEGD
jgi:drug/metabolite transporter (DMT)-like permease